MTCWPSRTSSSIRPPRAPGSSLLAAPRREQAHRPGGACRRGRGGTQEELQELRAGLYARVRQVPAADARRDPAALLVRGHRPATRYLRIYANQSEASRTDFLRRLRRVVPMTINKVLTDNGSQFTVSIQPSHLDSRRSFEEGVHLFRIVGTMETGTRTPRRRHADE